MFVCYKTSCVAGPVYLHQELEGVGLAFLALDPLDTLGGPPRLGLLPGGGACRVLRAQRGGI